MYKMVISAISLIAVFAMMVSFTGCSKATTEVENLMTEFEYACNTLDFDAVLRCIDPKISDKIQLAAGLVGMFAQTDTDEMFEKLAEYLSGDDVGGTGFFSSIKIDVTDIEVVDESAEVFAILTYNLNGSEVVRESVFHCVYYAEKWYISDYSIL